MPLQKKQIFHSLLTAINDLFLVCYLIHIPVFTNKAVILWGITACGIYAWMQKAIRIDLREILLTVSMVLFALITHRNLAGFLYIVFLPLVFALIGKYMIWDAAEKKNLEKRMYRMAVFPAVSYTVYGLLNSLVFLETGFTPTPRSWMDIWDQLPVPGTQQVFYFLPVMALFFPAVIYFRQHVFPCLTVLFFNILFLYISLKTTSRISLVIWGAVLLWEYMIWYILNRRRINRMKAAGTAGFICLACLVISGIFIWKLRNDETFASLYSWIGRDGGILNNIRFKVHISVIKQIPVYPAGGYHMDLAGIGYAHNVWLDMVNAAGIIPFATLTGYTFITVFDILKLLKSGHTPQKIKYIISGLYFVLIVYYMVETALEASVINLLPWVYTDGIVHAYLSSSVREFEETRL